jgi:hypothetical protein
VVRTSKSDDVGRAFEAVGRESDIACRRGLAYLHFLLSTVKGLGTSVLRS